MNYSPAQAPTMHDMTGSTSFIYDAPPIQPQLSLSLPPQHLYVPPPPPEPNMPIGTGPMTPSHISYNDNNDTRHGHVFGMAQQVEEDMDMTPELAITHLDYIAESQDSECYKTIIPIYSKNSTTDTNVVDMIKIVTGTTVHGI